MPPDASEIGVAEDAPGEPARAFENAPPSENERSAANASSWDETAASEPMKKTVVLTKPAALAAIREDLGDCTRCKLHQLGRKQIVFGVGNPDARLMFVGEGPGADEDAAGRALRRAGRAVAQQHDLRHGTAARGCLHRQRRQVPPAAESHSRARRVRDLFAVSHAANRHRAAEDHCRPRRGRRPKTLLGINDSMAKLRGRIYDFSPALPKDAPEREAEFSTKLAVTYHPAYLLRDPRQKKEAWQDLADGDALSWTCHPRQERRAEARAG